MIKYLAVALFVCGLLSCSSTDSLIGDVSLSKCLNTRSFNQEESDSITECHELVKLTRGERDVYCEWCNFWINCMTSDVIVDCEKEDGKMVIRYSQVYKDGIGATCSCPVTLYFTIRDAAQDRFMLVIRDRTYEVDFNGGGTATLDLSKPLAE